MTPFGRFRITLVLFKIIMTDLPEIYLLKQKNRMLPSYLLDGYHQDKLLLCVLRQYTNDAVGFGLYYQATCVYIICF